MAITHNKVMFYSGVSLSVKYLLLSSVWLLLSGFSLQDVRLCGQADGQFHGKRLSPVCRDGPRAASRRHRQLYQQSHAGTAAAEMRELKNLTSWTSGDVGEILKRFDKPKPIFCNICQMRFKHLKFVFMLQTVYMMYNKLHNNPFATISLLFKFLYINIQSLRSLGTLEGEGHVWSEKWGNSNCAPHCRVRKVKKVIKLKMLCKKLENKNSQLLYQQTVYYAEPTYNLKQTGRWYNKMWCGYLPNEQVKGRLAWTQN